MVEGSGTRNEYDQINFCGLNLGPLGLDLVFQSPEGFPSLEPYRITCFYDKLSSPNITLNIIHENRNAHLK